MDAIQPRKFRKDQLPHLIPDMYLVRQLHFRAQISKWIVGFGVVILVLGGLILIGGPDSIMVGPRGPAVGEKLLLMPGFVVTVGGGIATMGAVWGSQGIHKIDQYVAKNYRLVNKEGEASIEGIIKGVATDDGELILHFLPVYPQD